MVIKEEKVDIMTVNDREVIIQIIKIITQEYLGSSCHIMSDNIMSIYFKRCIIASEFIMDIDIHIMFSYVQASFTKELIIQLKNHPREVHTSWLRHHLAHRELWENPAYLHQSAHQSCQHHQEETIYQTS